MLTTPGGRSSQSFTNATFAQSGSREPTTFVITSKATQTRGHLYALALCAGKLSPKKETASGTNPSILVKRSSSLVCRGYLQNAQQWGCGRRFTRADALGRHFRSEGGHVCTKPLLDEEALGKQERLIEDQQIAQAPASSRSSEQMPMQQDMMGNFIPAALLQLYPALARTDWGDPKSLPEDNDTYSGQTHDA